MTISYTAVATSSGTGRDGQVHSSDKQIDLPVRMPAAMGGNGEGTNPEQLFAAADALLQQAHQLCPYSKATRGNLDVTLRATV